MPFLSWKRYGQLIQEMNFKELGEMVQKASKRLKR